MESYEILLAHMTEYFNSNIQYSQILDVKVPININIVKDIYQKIMNDR